MKFSHRISSRVDIFAPVFPVSFSFAAHFVFPYFLVKTNLIPPPSTALYITDAVFDKAFVFSAIYYSLWVLGYYFLPRSKFFEPFFKLRIRLKSISSLSWLPGTLALILLFFSFMLSKYLSGFELDSRSQLTSGVQGRFVFIYLSFFFVFSSLFLEAIFAQISSFGIVKLFADLKFRLKSVYPFILVLLYFLSLIPLGGRSRALSLAVVVVCFYNYYISPLRVYQVVLLGISGLALALYLSGDSLSIQFLPSLLFSTRPRIFDGIYNLASVVGLSDQGLLEQTYFLSTLSEIFKDLGLFNVIEILPTPTLFMSQLLSVPPSSVIYSFPISIPGELYLSIGVFGILLLSPFFGMLSASFYQSFLSAKHSGVPFCVTAYWIGISILPGMTGGLSSKLVAELVSIFFLIFLSSFLASLRGYVFSSMYNIRS